MSIRPEAARAATAVLRKLPKNDLAAWPAIIDEEVAKVPAQYQAAVREVARLAQRARERQVAGKRAR